MIPSSLKNPGWRRSVWLRRALALVLLIAAAGVWLAQRPGAGDEVLVFARDVPAGTRVSAGDITTLGVPEGTAPGRRMMHSDKVIGEITVAAAQAGEVVTDTRVISGALKEMALSSDVPVDVVPLTLASPEVIPLLHHGDTVTVVSRGEENPEPEVLAEGARAVLDGEVPEHGAPDSSSAHSPATVLVVLPADAARVVAAAALSRPIALIITGDRAGGND